MSLRCQGETVTSGPQQAASKKAAGQLAAQVLLDSVSRHVSGADVVPVGEEDLSRLQSANPKGQLLERCEKKRWAAPQFEQHANPQGYQVRAVLDRDDEQRACSAWYLAATLKAAEQAAAEEMLKILRSEPASDQRGSSLRETLAADKLAADKRVERRDGAERVKQVGILHFFRLRGGKPGRPKPPARVSIVGWATTPTAGTVAPLRRVRRPRSRASDPPPTACWTCSWNRGLRGGRRPRPPAYDAGCPRLGCWRLESRHGARFVFHLTCAWLLNGSFCLRSAANCRQRFWNKVREWSDACKADSNNEWSSDDYRGITECGF